MALLAIGPRALDGYARLEVVACEYFGPARPTCDQGCLPEADPIAASRRPFDIERLLRGSKH